MAIETSICVDELISNSWCSELIK